MMVYDLVGYLGYTGDTFDLNGYIDGTTFELDGNLGYTGNVFDLNGYIEP